MSTREIRSIRGLEVNGPRTILILSTLLLFSALGQTQTNKVQACALFGTDTVYSGSAASFTLTVGCKASGWSASCGKLMDQSTSSVTVGFGMANCGTAVITGSWAGGTASKKVYVVPPPLLVGNSIGTGAQYIGYGKIPHMLSAPDATGGGCGGGYAYQWYSSTDNSKYAPITGAISKDYQPGPLTTTTYFKRQASCIGSSSGSSTMPIMITVLQPMAQASITPASQSVAIGGLPISLSLLKLPLGININIQWESSRAVNFAQPSTLPGATGPSYSPGQLDTTTYFRAAIILNGDTVFSAPSVVAVQPPLQGGTISPATQSLGYDSVPSVLGLMGVTGGDGNYSYQWQSSTDGSNWSAVDGASTPTYSPGPLRVTTYFRVLVACKGLQATSGQASIQVAPAPPLSGMTTNPINQTTNTGL